MTLIVRSARFILSNTGEIYREVTTKAKTKQSTPIVVLITSLKNCGKLV
jgi:hypothetical protein